MVRWVSKIVEGKRCFCEKAEYELEEAVNEIRRQESPNPVAAESAQHYEHGQRTHGLKELNWLYVCISIEHPKK